MRLPTNSCAEPKIYALTELSRTLSIIRTLDGTVKTLTLPSEGDALAMSPDGDRLFVASTVSGIAVIDTVSDRPIQKMIETGGRVFDIAITPDGEKLFMAMSMKGVKRLLLKTGDLKQITDRICPEHLRLDPPGKTLYVSYQCGGPTGRSGHDALEVFDAETEKSLGVVTGPPIVGGNPDVSPDGRLVMLDGRDACLSAGYDHQGCPPGLGYVLHLMWADTRHVFKTLGLHANTRPGRFLDSTHFLLLGDSIAVLDTATYSVLEKWEQNSEYVGAAVLQGRRQAYVGVREGNQLLALQAESPTCAPAAEGLASFYPGDGVSQDITSGATLTMEGDVQFGPGRVGQAFFFDGRSAYLTAPGPSHYRFGYRDSTVALYVKFQSLDGDMTMLDGTEPETPLHARLFKSKDQHFIFELMTIHGEPVRLRSVTPAVPHRWYHLALTKNDHDVSLYVDGELEDRKAFGPRHPATPLNEPIPLYLGAARDRKGLVHGKLDEILFYNRALSELDVRRLYQMRESGPCQI